jgi:hypothetical protein
VDDILIWSKDPMAVIKALEKTYMLKSVGIPEYYLVDMYISLEKHGRILE